MIFKTIEDEAGRTSFAVSDTFNNLISDIQTLFYKKSAKSNFTFLGDFTSSVESDKKAILSYIESVRSGVSPTEALAQCFATASIEAKDFAASLDNVEKISEEAIQGNIAKFESQQKQLNISTQAQNKSLANARTLITEYNAILSDKANKEKEGYTALSKSGLSQEEFCEAVQKSNPPLAKYLSGLHTANGTTRGYVGSLIAAKAATIGLRIATTALNTVLSMGIGLIVQGLLWGLGKLCEKIDGLIITQKEAAEAAEEAVKAYEEQSSKLNDLTKKLEESKKRYKELYDIQQTSSLTFVEEEELNKLKETNEQLELQIANEKELQQINANEANEKLATAFNKQSYTSIAYESAIYDYNALKESKKELLDFYSDLEMNAARYADEHNLTDEEYEKYYQGLLDNMGEYQDTIAQLYELEKKWNPDLGASTEIVDYKTYIDEVIQRYNYLNQLKADGNKLSDEQSSQLDKIRNDILAPMMSELKTNYIDKYIGDDDTLNGWKDIYDSIGKALYGAEYFAQKLDELPDVLKTKFEALGKQGALTADNIDKLSEQYPQLNKWMEQSGYTADDVAKYYNKLKNSAESLSAANENLADSFVSSLSSIQNLSKGINQLDKIYADIFDGESFDFGSIIGNEDFQEAFGALGESYTDFIKTIATNSNDVSACQKAFDNLTTAYIYNSGALSGVTDETRDATVVMLEQMGVTNAATIVDEQLAYQKERLLYATEEYADKALDEIEREYDVATASDVARQCLAELWLQKVNLNTYKIDTSSDIQQIIDMANAANAAASSIAELERAKSVISAVEKGTAAGFHMLENGDYDEALKTIESINNGTFNYNFQGLKASDFTHAVYGGGSSTRSAKDSAAKASEKASKEADKEETWFEKQYKLHKHLVSMEQETDADYYNWLSAAIEQAYGQGILELDDYRKYQEEAFSGMRSLFKDYLNDVEHEISMRENYDGESKKIISLYKTLISKVESEIAAARRQGLTDNDDYIQELQDKWQSYSKSIKDIQEDITDAAKDALDNLVDYRIDMIKKDVDREKEALDEKLDNLKDFYDKQKEMLQDAADEEKYLEEQSEKRKSVTDIQSRLSQLEYDNSAWAEKRKAELRQELADAQKDLDSFEKDHALELAIDALDEAYNSQEAQIQSAIDALDKKLNDPSALYNQALADIKNTSRNQLYYMMMMYNRQYGDGNDSTIEEIWNKSIGALDDYKALFGKDYQNESSVKQSTMTNTNLYSMTEKGVISSPDYWISHSGDDKWLNTLFQSLNDKTVSDVTGNYTDVNSAINALKAVGAISDPNYWRNAGKTIKWLDSFLISAANHLNEADMKQLTTTNTNLRSMVEKGIISSADYWLSHSGDNRWMNTLIQSLNETTGVGITGNYTDINSALRALNAAGAISSPEYWKGICKKIDWLDSFLISAANHLNVSGYASGTRNATAGLHAIDELGDEYVFTSSDGTRYKMLNSGDHVLNAKATDFLYDFANGGGEILEKIIKTALGGGIFDKIMPVVNNNEINMGDIVIQGDCKEKTVSEIRRAQRENVSNMLKAFNNLNK